MELGLQTLLIMLRREEVNDMLWVYVLYFIPIQVLNSILLQTVYSKGCMLKSETDGPVLYFSSFRISHAAQGPWSSGTSNYISAYYTYISVHTKTVRKNYSKSTWPQPLLVLSMLCALDFNWKYSKSKIDVFSIPLK